MLSLTATACWGDDDDDKAIGTATATVAATPPVVDESLTKLEGLLKEINDSNAKTDAALLETLQGIIDKLEAQAETDDKSADDVSDDDTGDSDTEAEFDEFGQPNNWNELVASTGSMPDYVSRDASHGKWQITLHENIDTDPVVRDWLNRLEDPNPHEWKYFPNVGNPDRPDFPSEPDRPAPWGAEYGVANVPFCQQDMRCDFVVPAWHFRLITADYAFMGESCRGEGKKGCLLLLINVMDQSFTWRDQIADNGFSVPGRYWDGDHLEWAVLGLVSHASANMLNLETFAREGEVLNAGDGGNAGANCGTPNACQTVDALVVVHAGDRILATARTTVTP